MGFGSVLIVSGFFFLSLFFVVFLLCWKETEFFFYYSRFLVFIEEKLTFLPLFISDVWQMGNLPTRICEMLKM